MSEHHELALALKMIPALAFEKRGNREIFWTVEEMTNVEDQQHLDSFVVEKIGKLCLYFQSNYINCPLLNCPPIFIPQIWNPRDAAIEEIAKNN